MSDRTKESLVDNLRRMSAWVHHDLLNEAATEIASLTARLAEAEKAARMLWTSVTCHDLHHTPAQYHQSYEPCKARAAFVEKYPFLKENPNESDQTP